MDIDITTYNDLSLFHHEEEFSVFHKLNFTRTSSGKFWLQKFFNEPFSDIKRIEETQQIIALIHSRIADWPSSITNGTIMVMERFYESAIDTIPDTANGLNAITYKILHTPDFSLVRYSLTHFADFIRGFKKIIGLLEADNLPVSLRLFIDRAKGLLDHHLLENLAETDATKKLSSRQTVLFGNYILYRFKQHAQELINIYGRLDAWQAMATAMQRHRLFFPTFVQQSTPYIDARELYHILLRKPIPYDVHLSKDSNFIFLTGANMAGKSTFIKAVGTAVFLA